MTAPYDRVYPDQMVGQNRDRIVKIENTQVGDSVIITDGITTVTPLLQLDIGPGLTLTDLTGGEAEVAVDDYISFTPTLSAISGSGSSPAIGASGTAFGRYVQLNEFVHYYGSLLFGGSGLTSGTGLWQVDLPVASAFQLYGGPIGLANFSCFTCVANIGNQMQMEAQQTPVGLFQPDASHFAFYYLSAYPYGTLSMFDHTAPWGVGAGDILTWNTVYQAT